MPRLLGVLRVALPEARAEAAHNLWDQEFGIQAELWRMETAVAEPPGLKLRSTQ